MSKDVFIGIDLGTSSIKAVALSGDGAVLASASRNIPLMRGPGGRAEQHPDMWEQAGGECLRELANILQQKGFRPIAAACTGQMDGPVLLDPEGRPVREVPLWCDVRCAPQCDWIRERLPDERVLELTGHTTVTGYTAPKVRWIAEHDPDALTRAAHMVFPKDYLTKLLTSRIVSDFSDASNSLFLNVREARWEKSILDALELSDAILPELAESAERVGVVTEAGARWSGLPVGIPVAAGAGDSIAAALGAGIQGREKLQIVIGTAGNVNCALQECFIDLGGRAHTGLYMDRHSWIVSGVLQASGGSLAWWRDVIGRDLDAACRNVNLDAPNAVVFAPYLAGERSPYLDPLVRGAFVSLEGGSTLGDMTRAVLEGVAFSFRDVVEVFRGMDVAPRSMVLTGGGANSNLLCQFLADTIALPLTRIGADVTARGAAILAACVAGRFSHWKHAADAWPLEGDLFDVRRAEQYEAAYRRFRLLYPHLAQYARQTTNMGGLT